MLNSEFHLFIYLFSLYINPSISTFHRTDARDARVVWIGPVDQSHMITVQILNKHIKILINLNINYKTSTRLQVIPYKQIFIFNLENSEL